MASSSNTAAPSAPLSSAPPGTIAFNTATRFMPAQGLGTMIGRSANAIWTVYYVAASLKAAPTGAMVTGWASQPTVEDFVSAVETVFDLGFVYPDLVPLIGHAPGHSIPIGTLVAHIGSHSVANVLTELRSVAFTLGRKTYLYQVQWVGGVLAVSRSARPFPERPYEGGASPSQGIVALCAMDPITVQECCTLAQSQEHLPACFQAPVVERFTPFSAPPELEHDVTERVRMLFSYPRSRSSVCFFLDGANRKVPILRAPEVGTHPLCTVILGGPSGRDSTGWLQVVAGLSTGNESDFRCKGTGSPHPADRIDTRGAEYRSYRTQLPHWPENVVEVSCTLSAASLAGQHLGVRTFRCWCASDASVDTGRAFAIFGLACLLAPIPGAPVWLSAAGSRLTHALRDRPFAALPAELDPFALFVHPGDVPIEEATDEDDHQAPQANRPPPRVRLLVSHREVREREAASRRSRAREQRPPPREPTPHGNAARAKSAAQAARPAASRGRSPSPSSSSVSESASRDVRRRGEGDSRPSADRPWPANLPRPPPAPPTPATSARGRSDSRPRSADSRGRSGSRERRPRSPSVGRLTCTQRGERQYNLVVVAGRRLPLCRNFNNAGGCPRGGAPTPILDGTVCPQRNLHSCMQCGRWGHSRLDCTNPRPASIPDFLVKGLPEYSGTDVQDTAEGHPLCRARALRAAVSALGVTVNHDAPLPGADERNPSPPPRGARR